MSSTRGHDGSLDEALRALAERCAGPGAPAPHEVEAALERGFGALLALEARLQRLQKGSADGWDGGSAETVSRDALQEQIASLRMALEDLRSQTAPEGCSPLALGFVLPTTDL